ncbi:MAG TPA: hypothetical protein VIY69_17535 [Candidatus Acidoferrales bacterium]
MRIVQILLGVFLVLYAINTYVNRPSVPRSITIDVNSNPLDPIDVRVYN